MPPLGGARRPVPVVGFRAGEFRLAIAAEAVASMGAPLAESPHVAALVGVESAGKGEERCGLLLQDGTRTLDVVVDGPVTFESIGPGDIIPFSKALPIASMKPVVGFARAGGDAVTVLLDIPSLIDEAARLRLESPDSA